MGTSKRIQRVGNLLTFLTVTEDFQWENAQSDYCKYKKFLCWNPGLKGSLSLKPGRSPEGRDKMLQTKLEQERWYRGTPGRSTTFDSPLMKDERSNVCSQSISLPPPPPSGVFSNRSHGSKELRRVGQGINSEAEDFSHSPLSLLLLKSTPKGSLNGISN